MLLSKFIIVSINSSSSSLQKYKFLEIIVFLEKKNPTNKQKKEEATGGEKNLSIFNDRTSCAIIPCLRLKFIDRIVRYLTRAFPPSSPPGAHPRWICSLCPPPSPTQMIFHLWRKRARERAIFFDIYFIIGLSPLPQRFFSRDFECATGRGGGGGSAAFVAGRYPLSTGPLL